MSYSFCNFCVVYSIVGLVEIYVFMLDPLRPRIQLSDRDGQIELVIRFKIDHIQVPSIVSRWQLGLALRT